MNLFDPLAFSDINYIICYGTNTTITLPHVLPTETATWGVTGGISIIDSTHNSITVTATNPGTNGAASVTATFGTQSVTIQFSDISDSELLPKAVYLYHESSTIPKNRLTSKKSMIKTDSPKTTSCYGM